MFYAPCHPDCLCVCKDLDEDHPDVVQSHTPPTEEQREAWTREQEILERAAETAERKARADRAWKLEQTYSPDAKDSRRLEREERRLKPRTQPQPQPLIPKSLQHEPVEPPFSLSPSVSALQSQPFSLRRSEANRLYTMMIG